MSTLRDEWDYLPVPFAESFTSLTGHLPFPWQQALYDRFEKHSVPKSCNIPTGIGKTNFIVVWLVALLNRLPSAPRRLIYVVNRRTVVDQTTDVVEKLREQLEKHQGLSDRLRRLCGTELPVLESPLAVSTLRGQFADNRAWSADPSRPAVICGTVDMIGSRLLFSGYGVGFRAKPLHAGFLGQDALLVHDEAHLEPAFQELVESIEKEQKRCGDFKRLTVVELSATARGSANSFELTPADYQDLEVNRRVHAKKELRLHSVEDEKRLSEEIVSLALGHDQSGDAIIVFVRSVEAVSQICKKLPPERTERLTGTLRGKERDELVETPIFQRFLPKSNRSDDVEPALGAVYLICTSAGEVGVNISADHLICDLSTFESMAQRFGRVNRFGLKDATIDVVNPSTFDGTVIDSRRQRTLDLLERLHGDASPASLGRLDPDDRKSAFAPYRPAPPTTDILFDAWSLTSIRDRIPGRPMVDVYLHGEADDPPQTKVAWRLEVELLTDDLLVRNNIEPRDVIESWPLKPHEELSGPTYKVFKELERIAARCSKTEGGDGLRAWVVDLDGAITPYLLTDLVAKNRSNRPAVPLEGRTLILPPNAGGLAKGLLQGDAPHSPDTLYDVSEEWFHNVERTIKRRMRLMTADPKPPQPKGRYRLVISHEVGRASDEESSNADTSTSNRYWHWFARPENADDDGSKTAVEGVTWDEHTADVVTEVDRIAAALDLPSDLRSALVVAAKGHDLGKRREIWQRSIGNPNPGVWYAKSKPEWRPFESSRYRHEFGSLLDVEREDSFAMLDDSMKELVLHLIAAHHGRGRPHFDVEEAFDPVAKGSAATRTAEEVPLRFARLQRRYGRWGLAYLESILRAADIAASSRPGVLKVKQ